MGSFILFFVAFICLSSAKLAPLRYAQGKNVQHIEDHYIVVFKNETPSSVFEKQLLLTKSAIGEENFGHVYKTALTGFSSKLTGDQLLEIRKNPFVQYAFLFIFFLFFLFYFHFLICISFLSLSIISI